MATEHEFKWVLPLKFSEKKIKAQACEIHKIKQGYLPDSKGNTTLRVRCVEQNDVKHWFLTLKHKTKNRVIEIEQRIDARDALDLWKDCDRKLKKTRYVVRDKYNQAWEIDFIKKDKTVYFVQAELELMESEKRPTELPDFIRDEILYEVPLTDDRFSNKRLGDVDYAKKLYQTLGEKK